MIGVTFQPGEDPNAQQNGGRTPPQNVQEAIKVLSLRLPRVVGAQAIAPAPLLQSQGSGGNPRVDSVVDRIIAQMFPTSGPQTGLAPTLPTAAASTPRTPWSASQSGPQPSMTPERMAQRNTMPRVIVDQPNTGTSTPPPAPPQDGSDLPGGAVAPAPRRPPSQVPSWFPMPEPEPRMPEL